MKKEKIKKVKAKNKKYQYWLGKTRANKGTGLSVEYISGKRKQKKEYHQAYTKKMKLEIFGAYCGKTIECACCGEKELDFLSVDHINGGGNKHRKEVNSKGNSLYRWIINNKFPPMFQILCYNCNFAKDHTIDKKCPHKRTITYSLKQ